MIVEKQPEEERQKLNPPLDAKTNMRLVFGFETIIDRVYDDPSLEKLFVARATVNFIILPSFF